MNSISLCGVTEIRTRDALLTHTRFPGEPIQPLLHHSNQMFYKGSTFKHNRKKIILKFIVSRNPKNLLKYYFMLNN